MPEAATGEDVQRYSREEVVNTDEVMVIVTCIIPKQELKAENPASIRERYGEKVYAIALRKAGM